MARLLDRGFLGGCERAFLYLLVYLCYRSKGAGEWWRKRDRKGEVDEGI